jgi:protein-S-isoprenylcysteine O-methyltransferase Ste14
MPAGFLDWFQVTVLGCWIAVGSARMILQYNRGGRVIVIDRQRSPAEQLSDLLALLCMGTWWYEVAAQVWPLTHIVPAALRLVIVDAVLLRVSGVLLWLLAFGVYAVAMKQMAASWRIGIDRAAPGELVSTGVFGRTRNPIYLSFDLALLATFLTSGRLDYLLLGSVLAFLLHGQIRREERFLGSVYGEAYRRYCDRVRRYG